MKITLDKVLLSIIALLLLILVIGTTVGVTKQRTQTPQVLISQGKAVNLAAPADTENSTFYNLGTLRIVTTPDAAVKDDSGSPMVLTPWISYAEGDTVFFEEISRKQGVIKGVFSQFFATHTQKEILSFGEEKIKESILADINSYLSLGKITDIYFTDFLFL